MNYDQKTKELEQALAAAPPDSPERVDALNELGWHTWGREATQAEGFIEEADALAERLGYKRGQMFALRATSLLAYGRGEAQRALKGLNEARHWFEENDEHEGLADANLGIAYIYWGFGDFRRGLELAHSALDQFTAMGSREGQAWASNALGGFYYDWHDHEKATRHYQKAHDIAEEMGNLVSQARALGGLGNTHLLEGDAEQALAFHKQSLELCKRAANEFGKARALNDIGIALQQLDRHEEALDFHSRALEIRERLGYLVGACTCMLDIGKAQLVLRRYDEAGKTLDKALMTAEKVESKTKMIRAHELLSQLHRDLGQFDVALVHFENFHRITEEVFHEDAEQKLRNLRAASEIETAEKNAEIERLKSVELKGKNDELQRTLDELHSTQAQLLQDGKMAALGNLVAGLAHEINSPIGAIKSAADVNRRALARVREILAKHESEAADLAGQLSRALEVLNLNSDNTVVGVDRIEKIVNSLRNFSRLDESPFQLANVHEGLESTLTLIEGQLGENIEVVKNFGEIPNVYLYAGEMNQVFMNLLLNAAQAVGERGTIDIRTWHEGDRVNVEIKDDGRGIPPDKINTLFEPGFTRKQATVRMRTGLYTSYNIVRNHLGELSVESDVGKGAAFRISIPDRLDVLLGGAVRPA